MKTHLKTAKDRKSVFHVVKEFNKPYESKHRYEPDQLPASENKGIMNQGSDDLIDVSKEEINCTIKKYTNKIY